MNHDSLIEIFGLRLGASGMKFNQDRSCVLNFSDEYVIIVSEVNKNLLILNGIIGILPQKEQENTILEILSLNTHFANIGGPYVSYEASNNALLLVSPLFTEGMDAIALEEQVKYLISQIDYIHRYFDEKGIIVE